jgi:hypothetical protein
MCSIILSLILKLLKIPEFTKLGWFAISPALNKIVFALTFVYLLLIKKSFFFRRLKI